MSLTRREMFLVGSTAVGSSLMTLIASSFLSHEQKVVIRDSVSDVSREAVEQTPTVVEQVFDFTRDEVYEPSVNWLREQQLDGVDGLGLLVSGIALAAVFFKRNAIGRGIMAIGRGGNALLHRLNPTTSH